MSQHDPDLAKVCHSLREMGDLVVRKSAHQEKPIRYPTWRHRAADRIEELLKLEEKVKNAGIKLSD